MTNNNLCYEFGPYQLDPSKRILTREGEIIPLTPKATEILIVLVEHAGQLVEKDEILKEVWADTFVEEANLSQNVFMLRRALGDERAEPRYIETVAKRGYRFIAPVRAVPQVVNGGLPAQSAGVSSQSPVVAVLPFLNNTGDPELEYLADGITSNVINNLSRITQLRVMSRSTVFRYKEKADVDLQQVAQELRVDAVLVGKINMLQSDLAVTVELVNAITGWQLWGATLNSESTDLLQVENNISRHVIAALQLQLSDDQEKHITARYTENAEAYDAYIEGRYHWSRYTRKGIEKAMRHFRHAIKLDPNYALAYAALVDCYLRLATNYLPDEDHLTDPLIRAVRVEGEEFLPDSKSKVKLRFEWDWKGAERELRRANELKTNYPAAHQWYAAYKMAEQIYNESCISIRDQNQPKTLRRRSSRILPNQIASIDLTPSEQVQVNCTIAREQIDLGNHEAACKILCARWTFGDWPRLDGLNQQSCADLLFTAGELASYVANTTQTPRGQKHAEELLNGSIALFEQLGLRRRAAEGRIELALCYYRQGLFDIGRYTLTRVLDQLSEESSELRGLALIRLATVERHAGRLKDALSKLQEAMPIVELTGPWTTARCFLELASTYKDLAIAETSSNYSDQAKDFYIKALSEFEAIGHHRYVAVVENNLGFLLLGAGLYKESEEYLLRSLRSFTSFSDSIAAAQVNETLARLYIETKQYDLAQEVVDRAVKILDRTDGEALLAEAVTTSGLVAAKQLRFNDAKKSFEAAYNIAERCGDSEGAGRALLIMLEELKDSFAPTEKTELLGELTRLLSSTQQRTLKARVENLVKTIKSSCEEAH